MQNKYKTAILGLFILLFSFLFSFYSNSKNNIQSLTSKQLGYKNLYQLKSYTQVPYSFMTLTGCKVKILDITPYPGSRQEEYENLSKNRSCNFVNYYLYGPGGWLSFFALVLIIINILDVYNKNKIVTSKQKITQTREMQKSYLKFYFGAFLAIFILEGSAIILFNIALMAWGQSSFLNFIAEKLIFVTLIISPFIYLALLRFGWGMHKMNLRKIVLLGIIFPIPLFWLLRLFF